MGWCKEFKRNIQNGNLRIKNNRWEFKGVVITQCPFCPATLIMEYNDGLIVDKEGNVYE